MAKCHRDPIEVLHERMRDNPEILKGLNGESKKDRETDESIFLSESRALAVYGLLPRIFVTSRI